MTLHEKDNLINKLYQEAQGLVAQVEDLEGDKNQTLSQLEDSQTHFNRMVSINPLFLTLDV